MTSESPIVVGVDGSPSSVLAFQEGARLAGALGVPLVAVTAWRYPPFFGKQPGAAWSPETDANDILDHAISDAYDAEMYTLRLRMWWFPQVEIAYLFPVAVTLLWGGWLVAQGQTTVGTVT